MANTKKKKVVKKNTTKNSNVKSKNVSNKSNNLTEGLKPLKKKTTKKASNNLVEKKDISSKKNTSKKSNYNKVQEKLIQDKKSKKIQEKRKKEVKEKKQTKRENKKIIEKKNNRFINKTIFYLKNIIIGIKSIIVKIIILLKDQIKKLSISLKKLFKRFKRRKVVIQDNNKNVKIKTEYSSSKKILKEKEEIFENKYQVFRSITGRVIPSTFLRADKKKRKKVYLKEAFIFMIILSITDFIGFYKTKYIDMFHIFDNSLWNLLATIILTLLVTFFGSYLIDYVLTEIILKIRKKKILKGIQNKSGSTKEKQGGDSNQSRRIKFK